MSCPRARQRRSHALLAWSSAACTEPIRSSICLSLCGSNLQYLSIYPVDVSFLFYSISHLYIVCDMLCYNMPGLPFLSHLPYLSYLSSLACPIYPSHPTHQRNYLSIFLYIYNIDSTYIIYIVQAVCLVSVYSFVSILF